MQIFTGQNWDLLKTVENENFLTFKLAKSKIRQIRKSNLHKTFNFTPQIWWKWVRVEILNAQNGRKFKFPLFEISQIKNLVNSHCQKFMKMWFLPFQFGQNVLLFWKDCLDLQHCTTILSGLTPTSNSMIFWSSTVVQHWHSKGCVSGFGDCYTFNDLFLLFVIKELRS